jgi:hypothetical protein
MTYAEMLEGYRRLYARLLTDRAIAERIRNKMRWEILDLHHQPRISGCNAATSRR